MKPSHGKLVMAVMAMVMAVMACSVKWEGGGPPFPPSMTAPALPSPSMSATRIASSEPGECLIVQALPGSEVPGSLNLRSGPGTEFSSITVLSDGQLLASIGLEQDWYSVTVQGDPSLAGYVNAAYVEACP